MDLIERATRSPFAALVTSTLLTLAAAAAIFGLGAPPWILLVVAWGGVLVYGAVSTWVDRRTGRRLR